jgi:hypothetical protein
METSTRKNIIGRDAPDTDLTGYPNFKGGRFLWSKIPKAHLLCSNGNLINYYYGTGNSGRISGYLKYPGIRARV